MITGKFPWPINTEPAVQGVLQDIVSNDIRNGVKVMEKKIKKEKRKVIHGGTLGRVLSPHEVG